MMSSRLAVLHLTGWSFMKLNYSDREEEPSVRAEERLINKISASATQSRSKLEFLECHFTWNLDTSRSELFQISDVLVDIGTDEGNIWLGHIYNLQGFIHYKLGFIEEARDLFSRATETFQQLGDADEGPWLVVNYGNLAWLHQHLGEDSESQAYLSKLDTLMEKHPPPIQDELHPEVCAEKAWTLMTFYKEEKLQAADYFQRAIRMKPDMVPWRTSRMLAVVGVYKYDEIPGDDIMQELRMARQEDPENLHLAAVDLLLRAQKGEQVKDEAHELEEKILMNPVSSYSGIKALMRVYKQLQCYDEAIDLAEKALMKHPDNRYLKRCAAISYKWRTIFVRDSSLSESVISRAISLHEDVLLLYPHSSLPKEIDLANMWAKSGQGLMKADQMYQEMMERDLEPADKQMLYNYYAKYLNFDRREYQMSTQFNMKAAEIPHQSFFRQNSINTLKKIRDRGGNGMLREIQEFLQNLPDSESVAAQSRSKLESLECHFTWNLDPRRSRLTLLRDTLVDIGTDEGNIWLGHIYNLQGFIHYKLGFIEEARDLFSRATETFQQLGDADEGPWLVVNYGNLAWLHQHLGEDSESQAYLSKLDTLMEKHPPPIQDELHPEVCAEKAWTLMKFDKDKKLQAADYFQRAIRMKPDMVPWRTSRMLALLRVYKYDEIPDFDIMQELRTARRKDPENLYLAALDLLLRAQKGEQVKDEAHELEEKILMNPVSSYSGIKALMRVYKQLQCYDEAIDLAEKALMKHPDNRYLKRCAAISYKWRTIFVKDSSLSESVISRAISLHEEVVCLYPHSSLPKEIDLANMWAKSDQGLMKADQMYQEMMERDLEPVGKQMIYNSYAKYLNFDRREHQMSIQYHMKAAEIPHQSCSRQTSINMLKKIRDKGGNGMLREIQEFLQNLPDSESVAAQSRSKLESLECHFTWNLDPGRSRLILLRDTLVDIGTDEGNIWLGHIYNLQGFIHYKLGFIEEARDLFSRATETFQQLGDADEGPWLVVNYGNLAWLHQHLGEDSESQAYLSKLDTLMEKHPPPIQDELHPEVCAEKAWTLMKFDKDKKLQAADYFQRAIRMKPDMVPWRTSRMLALLKVYKYDEIPDFDILEELRTARWKDPENLYPAALDLLLRAQKGEQVKDEAHELEEKILMNPVSSYSGIKTLMRVYKQLQCYDEAIDLAEKALMKHPDNRYLKRCAAISYKWRTIFVKDSSLSESVISRAISLHEEVVCLYPHSSLPKEIDLANMWAKSGQGLMKADQMYQEMMERDLEPADKQKLYNCYAKFLHFDRREYQMSIQYHMKAAEIPHQSSFRQNSINMLKRIRDRGRNRMCREIQEFLECVLVPENRQET